MMTGKVVLSHSHAGYVNANATSQVNLELSDSHQYTPIQVATAVTFGVAVIQVSIVTLFARDFG